MKTLGRALLILAVFALVMGITYAAVTAGTSGSTTPQFQRGEEASPRPAPGQPNFANGLRPQFPGGERNESHGEGGGNLLFGMIKNTFVVAMVVVLIVVPREWIQRRRRTDQAG